MPLPYVDEIDVGASWETWETTNDDDVKIKFRDVYTGVTLDPIRVGTAQFAENLDAWEMKPRSRALRHTGRAPEHDGSTTTKETHPTQQTCCSRDRQNFNNPTTRRGGNHERNITFGSGPAFL